MSLVSRTCMLTVRAFVLAGVSLIALTGAAGQDRTIVRGKTLEQGSGQPIPGVNVIVRGEKKGTMTDTTGSFQLELPTKKSRIFVFSHVAYRKVRGSHRD